MFFGDTDRSQDIEQLRLISKVDRAHLIMLIESGIIEPTRARRLLATLQALSDADFAPIWLDRMPVLRGLFLHYEDHLIRIDGPDVGGILQTARSRNDLNATIAKLSLREPYHSLLREAQRLHAILLRRARRYSSVTMPVYTHGQAAMPITYGFYLASVTEALTRELGHIFAFSEDLRICPLGAGAAAGTDFPILTARSSRLLGFDSGPRNSLDAVASRDGVLQLLGAAVAYGVTLSRIATDMLQWSTAEFDFLRFPDELVGSSSAMPQKRNPFIFEHIQGRSAALLGAFVHCAGAMKSTPFTNSIAVSTEAIHPVRDALRQATEMIIATRLMVAGAIPNGDAMLRRAHSGLTSATAIANHLTKHANLDFRTAHHLVGAGILAAIESGHGSLEAPLGDWLKSQQLEIPADRFDVATIVKEQNFGGGPGDLSIETCISELERKWRLYQERLCTERAHWREADLLLDQEVSKQAAEAQPT